MKLSARGRRILELTLPALTVVAFVAGWEAFVDLRGIAPIYLPAPSSILEYLLRMIADGSMGFNLGLRCCGFSPDLPSRPWPASWSES